MPPPDPVTNNLGQLGIMSTNKGLCSLMFLTGHSLVIAEVELVLGDNIK